MPLKFVFGPSGSGKSTYLYQHVIEESEKYPLKNFIVLVPEQFTMQTQKDLVSMHPRHGIMNIDVLSFARLAYRVFEETGTKQMQVLDDEGNHEILGRVLLREYHEDGRLLIAELLSVYGGIKAEDLLHLAVQESVESGEDGGENRGHSLLRRVEGGTGEPLGLVVGRELVQQELELVFSLDP